MFASCPTPTPTVTHEGTIHNLWWRRRRNCWSRRWSKHKDEGWTFWWVGDRLTGWTVQVVTGQLKLLVQCLVFFSNYGWSGWSSDDRMMMMDRTIPQHGWVYQTCDHSIFPGKGPIRVRIRTCYIIYHNISEYIIICQYQISFIFYQISYIIYHKPYIISYHESHES